jgi:hypothetical protein
MPFIFIFVDLLDAVLAILAAIGGGLLLLIGMH